jgi:hypothetical protein
MGVADSPLRDRVIFVEGAPRSGTTWLVNLLATHPSIAGVGMESHLFDFGVDRLFDNLEGRDKYRHGMRRFVDRDELVDLVRELCDGIFLSMRAHLSDDSTPEFVVEKTPISGGMDGRDLERKRECYPDAWYIHIVRDREAVTRSLMRAPWMYDRSHDACAGLWDRAVGYARAALGDLPRYREVSYEELRDDPAAGCRALFEWLGVAAGENELETVRVLSRDQFSDLGAVASQDGRSTAATVAAAPRRLVSGARAALGRARDRGSSKGPTVGPGEAAAFYFVRALFDRDAEKLHALTTRSFEFLYRGEGGDVSLRGDEGRDALVDVAKGIFDRRYVSETWTSAGVGPSEWWTTTPGVPFSTIFFQALSGDARRVDVAFGLFLEGDLIRRALIIAGGPLSGRPVVADRE